MHRIAIVALIALAITVAAGFLVAALVAWLATVLGLAGALAATGVGFLAVALVLGLVLRSQARAAERRRRSQAALLGLVELALILLPRRRLQRLEAVLAAGAGIAALLAILLRPASAGKTQTPADDAPATGSRPGPDGPA